MKSKTDIVKIKLNDIYFFLKAILIYYLVFKRNNNKNIGEKIVFIDIRNFPLTRYVYTFIKFFDLNGYTVFIPKNFKLIASLLNKKGEAFYSNLVLSERIVKFGNPPRGSKILNISKETLSYDYFNELLSNQKNENTYHVPICQHPLMYHKNLWNIRIENHIQRKQSVFMAGDFDHSTYKKISEEKKFNVLDRVTISSFLEKNDRFFDIKSQNELDKFLRSTLDKKIILVKKHNFVINMESLRDVLKSFDFFLALPGYIMPLAHNIAEAMSAGCIPLIQDTYAALFHPALVNEVNAVTFTSLDDLNNRINEIFNYSRDEILYLRNNVIQYYSKSLMPDKIVDLIKSKNFEKIYLLAEDVSVNEIRNNNFVSL